VREAGEMDEEYGKIQGIQYIPIGELRERADEIPKNKPVVTVCRSGKRSAQATVLLKRAGIEQVANMAGGMIRWRELALP